MHRYAKSSYIAKEGENDRRPKGARKRSQLAQGSQEKGRNTKRTVYPGANELFTVGNGITEVVDDNYKQQEEKVFAVKHTHTEIKLLIEQLEKRKDEKTAQE